MRRLTSICLVLVISCAELNLLMAKPPSVTAFYPMGGQRGTKVEVTVDGTIPSGTQVSTSDAIKVTAPEKGNVFTFEISDEAVPGLHWVRFYNDDGATDPLPFVIGQIPETNETEPNDLVSKGNKIAATSVVNGKLGQGGDVDVFRFSLKKGQTVVAAADANWRLGSGIDLVMQLLTPRGIVVEQNDDDHGNDPLLSGTANEDGDWAIRVFGFPAKPNSSIAFAGSANYRYRLSVSVDGFANHAVPSVLSKSGKTPVRLAGWNLADEFLQPLALSPEELLGGNTFSHKNLSNSLQFELFDGAVFGSREPCSIDQPQPVEVPSAVCGVIDKPNDEDVFRFKVKAKERLEFRVESRSLGMPLDALIRVYNPDKSKRAENDDSARNVFDAKLAVTFPSDGDFLVGIRDRFSAGGWRYHYRLYIDRPKPSASLSLAAGQFVLAHDKPLAIPVTIARNNGFKEELAISAVGLPDGVVCPPVKSEAKGNSAKSVKLILKNKDSAKAAKFSGPLRIVATHGEATIEATHTLSAYNNHKSSALWMTRLPAPEPKKSEEPVKKDDSKK